MLLVDGYNLMFACGISRRPGPGNLERARHALLNFLAGSLDERERSHCIVVFDAHDAPRDAPSEEVHQQIRVQFAVGHATADELLAELIQRDSAPRRLLVVSSDHEVRRACQRRGGTSITSEDWHAELLRRRAENRQKSDDESQPPHKLNRDDVDYWIREFGVDGTSEVDPE